MEIILFWRDFTFKMFIKTHWLYHRIKLSLYNFIFIYIYWWSFKNIHRSKQMREYNIQWGLIRECFNIKANDVNIVETKVTSLQNIIYFNQIVYMHDDQTWLKSHIFECKTTVCHIIITDDYLKKLGEEEILNRNLFQYSIERKMGFKSFLFCLFFSCKGTCIVLF